MPPFFQRRAEWVWRPRGVHPIPFGIAGFAAEDEKNRYVYFRRTFSLERAAQSAHVLVSADGRYQLFVNGQSVGRGPSRCPPTDQQADPYDLRPYLRPGRNVIAALVHSYGRVTAWYEPPQWEHGLAFGCGGFFLQGEIVFDPATTEQRDPTSPPIRLDTGADWRCLESTAWQHDVPSGSLGYIEIYDARQAPVGWRTVDFDDSAWSPAEILRVPGRQFVSDIVPFPHMSVRDIPLLQESMADPQRTLGMGEVENAPAAANIAALFEHEPLRPLTHCVVGGSPQPGAPPIRDLRGLTVTTTRTHSVSFIIDFGRIVAGRIQFDVDAPDGAVLDYTHSERLREDGRVRIHQGIPGFDVPLAHRVILRGGRQTWEAFEWAGFRYVQVTARYCVQPLTVHHIGVNRTGYPVEARGHFECSDTLLNRIWQVGGNTVRLCMHDAYVDCPSREQRQWMGDGYVQMLVNFAAFGDTLLAARLLRQIAQSQLPDGLLMMCSPGDFSRYKSVNIPDFTLYWIMTLERYVQHTGDSSLPHTFFPVMLKAIGWFEQYLNADDLLTDVPHWVFVDWAELDKGGQVTALNAHFVAALNAAATLSRLVQQPDEAARLAELAARIAQAINDHLWDEERGVYVDARHSRRISQQSNAAVIAFGVAPQERWGRILAAILDDARLVLTRTGEGNNKIVPFDESRQVVKAQPFYSHHLHRALSDAGQFTALLNHVRQWGTLLEASDDTFRETWQVDDLTSLCHGWAATPTYDLSSEILGVKPLAPGFTRFRLAPHPADLAWARGVLPTPHGAIAVDWQMEQDQFELTVTVPEGTEAEVILPESTGLPWGEIKVDDRSVAGGIPPILAASGTHHVGARPAQNR